MVKKKYDPKRRKYFSNLFIYRKLKALAYKGGKCQKCGYDAYYGALEFHHRDPDSKEFSWVELRNKAWTTVMAELDKCDLLCNRCHKEEHQDPKLLKLVLAWRQEIDNHKKSREKQSRLCKCGKTFEPTFTKQVNCSLTCSNKFRSNIQWPANLPELVASSSKNAVAKKLGVSDKAVAKRLKRYHK